MNSICHFSACNQERGRGKKDLYLKEVQSKIHVSFLNCPFSRENDKHNICYFELDQFGLEKLKIFVHSFDRMREVQKYIYWLYLKYGHIRCITISGKNLCFMIYIQRRVLLLVIKILITEIRIIIINHISLTVTQNVHFCTTCICIECSQL